LFLLAVAHTLLLILCPKKKSSILREISFLSTADVEAAYKAIKAKGVKPNSEIMAYPPGGRFFSVNDPDGNVWNILQS
jgi:uncharacterized glyoxalase superfamily protein PhnB